MSRNQPEFDSQVRFFALLEVLVEDRPDLADVVLDVWATPNGGKRSPGEAGKMRESGQRPGVPDISAAIPAHGCHGLYIEMKAPKGHLSDEQGRRLSRLSARGYRTCVAYSWQEAATHLCEYLDVPCPRNAAARVETLLATRRAERKAARTLRRAATAYGIIGTPEPFGRYRVAGARG